MSRELHILKKVIFNNESLIENFKSSIVNLSRSAIFERCKRYKEDGSFERKSG